MRKVKASSGQKVTKLLFISILGIFFSLAITAFSAFKLIYADSPSTVNACVDGNGALRLLKKNDNCRKNETLIALSTGSSGGGGGNGYFGLPFISSYNDLSPIADKFKGQDFSGAIMQSNLFHGVDLQGVTFKNAYLTNVDFDTSNVTNSNFQNTFLEATAFYGSNFTNADFTNADLKGANFNNGSQANFTDANFTNADLTSSNGMDSANLTGVIWSNTICPDGTNSNNHSNTCIGHLTPSP